MDEKEDLRSRIYKCLDRMGPYHIFLLCTFATFSLTAGYSNSVPVFYTFTPRYHCGVSGSLDQEPPIKWNECAAGTSPFNCTFDPEEKYDSIVTDYHLVCSNRYLAALSSTIYFAGVTIGALIFGPLSDNIGRKRTLQITIIGHILMGLAIHFQALTPTVVAFIALRFIQGAFNQGQQTIAYTSLIELVSVRYRTLLGCIWEAFWSMGMIYVALISSFVYDWRTLQLYMLIPTALGVMSTFILPESMHWQWTRNDFKGIIKSYSLIARKNGDKEFLEEEKTFQSGKDWEKIKQKCESVETNEDKISTISSVKILFKSSILRKHILIMAFFWFTVTVTYYAITFFVPNLGGNRHQNIMMGGGVEIAGFFILYIAMSKFGRARVLGIFAILSASFSIIFGITEFIEDIDEATRDTLGVVLMLLAKALAISAFCGMYIFTGELFPTICRGTTFGICGFWSRVGSLIAPQIIALTEVVNPGLVMIVLAAVLACAGGLMFLLPETLKIQIPNTMQDVEELWGKGKKNVDPEDKFRMGYIKRVDE